MQDISAEVKPAKEQYRAWLKVHKPRQYAKMAAMDREVAQLLWALDNTDEGRAAKAEVAAFFEQPEHKAVWAEVGLVRSPSGALAILGLTADASKSEIRNAYRRLVRKHHPDVGGDIERFKQINSAYQILCPKAKVI